MPDAASFLPEGRLAWGLQLPVAAQSRHFAREWERDAGPAEIARVAEAADRAGACYVSVCDHVCVPRDRAETMSTVWYDTIATLAWVAARTRRVRLLSYVYVAPYRHPLATAKAFSTLDALSDGRVIVGLGAGHLEGEFAVLGVPFAGRGAALDEAIDLIAKALTEEFPEHDGPRWRVRDVGLRPRPVQQPRPPIWIGGSTRAARRRAAERGDGWLPQGAPPEGLGPAIAELRALRRERHGERRLDVGATSDWMYVGRPPFAIGPAVRSGSPESLAEPLRALRRLGVDHVGVRFESRSAGELAEQVERFGAEVAPLLED